MLGKDLIVSMDSVIIGASKSCNFNITQDFISICSPTERRTLGKLPTIYSWDISVDCLLGATINVRNLELNIISGRRCLLTFSYNGINNFAGWAYIKSLRETGSIGSLAKLEVSFEPDGPLYSFARNETGPFAEGQNIGITYSDQGIVIDWGSTINQYGAEIYAQPNNKFIIYNNTTSSWGLYKAGLNTIKEILGTTYNVQDLNDLLMAYGSDSYTELTTDYNGVHTLLVNNNRATIMKLADY